MKRGDWIVRKRTRAYENPWIVLYHHEVLDPSGLEGIYGLVHFRNKAIAIVPVDENLDTCLVGQYRFPLDRYSWEVPEGGGPLKEEARESAKRELKEETGLSAGILCPILEMDLSNSVTDEVSITYIALELTAGRPQTESTENLKLQKLPLLTAFEWVKQGKIRDALSVASLMKLQLIMLQNKIGNYSDLLKYFKSDQPMNG
jgi:ADP-ribose pyrophosphatase